MQGPEEGGSAGGRLWEEALSLDLAGLGPLEARGQHRPVWEQAMGWGASSLLLWAEGRREVAAFWHQLGQGLRAWVFAAPGESRSRLRWGLSRLRKDKGLSQPNLSASAQEDLGHPYVRSESGNRGLLGE